MSFIRAPCKHHKFQLHYLLGSITNWTTVLIQHLIDELGSPHLTATTWTWAMWLLEKINKKCVHITYGCGSHSTRFLCVIQIGVVWWVRGDTGHPADEGSTHGRPFTSLLHYEIIQVVRIVSPQWHCVRSLVMKGNGITPSIAATGPHASLQLLRLLLGELHRQTDWNYWSLAAYYLETCRLLGRVYCIREGILDDLR